MRIVVIALTLVVTATALVSSASGAVRYQRHVVPGQGVSLETPASWIAVDAKLPPATIERMKRENPKLAPYLGQLSGASSAAKFLAIDPSLSGGFGTNVNVVVVPTPDLTFSQYRRLLVAEIGSVVGSSPVDDRAVTIAGARAVRLSYLLHVRLGRAFTVQTLQYAFPRKGRSVVVTYTTLPRYSSRYASTFARSASSIRFSAG
jgi:hypothetical protein